MLADKAEISPFLRASLPSDVYARSKVLDAPTGYGRHAYWLAQRGLSVVALDLDATRIKAARVANPLVSDRIIWKVADLQKPSLIFDGTFDLMVCIHYFSSDIVRRAVEALKPKGYFILESFGGQGGNWRGLPLKGWARKCLEENFDIITLREASVGPLKKNVTLKVLAKKL